jgi:methyl-accepting chemotaxis protein
MATSDRLIVYFLALVSLAAAGLGIFQIVMATGPTHRFFSDAQALLKENIETADKTVSVLQDHGAELGQVERLGRRVGESARKLPSVMGRVADLLSAVQNTLGQTADSMRHLEEKTGFLTPGNRLSQNAEALEATAAEMRQLRDTMRETEEAGKAARGQAETAAESLSKIRDSLRAEGITPGGLAERIDRMHALSERASLASTMMWRQGLRGGIYLLLALILASLAGIWRRLAPRDATES